MPTATGYELEKGSVVNIIDGSYAVRVDQHEEYSHIGLCKDDFVVIGLQYNDLHNYSGVTKVHNIFIRNITTGAIYLHSAAFVKLVK